MIGEGMQIGDRIKIYTTMVGKTNNLLASFVDNLTTKIKGYTKGNTTMSTSAKVTFATCCVVAISIIGYVHYKQQYDREQLHQGVLRDIERQQRRKIENLYNLQQQLELTRELRQYAEKQNES